MLKNSVFLFLRGVYRFLRFFVSGFFFFVSDTIFYFVKFLRFTVSRLFSKKFYSLTKDLDWPIFFVNRRLVSSLDREQRYLRLKALVGSFPSFELYRSDFKELWRSLWSFGLSECFKGHFTYQRFKQQFKSSVFKATYDDDFCFFFSREDMVDRFQTLNDRYMANFDGVDNVERVFVRPEFLLRDKVLRARGAFRSKAFRWTLMFGVDRVLNDGSFASLPRLLSRLYVFRRSKFRNYLPLMFRYGLNKQQARGDRSSLFLNLFFYAPRRVRGLVGFIWGLVFYFICFGLEVLAYFRMFLWVYVLRRPSIFFFFRFLVNVSVIVFFFFFFFFLNVFRRFAYFLISSFLYLEYAFSTLEEDSRLQQDLSGSRGFRCYCLSFDRLIAERWGVRYSDLFWRYEDGYFLVRFQWLGFLVFMRRVWHSLGRLLAVSFSAFKNVFRRFFSCKLAFVCLGVFLFCLGWILYKVYKSDVLGLDLRVLLDSSRCVWVLKGWSKFADFTLGCFFHILLGFVSFCSFLLSPILSYFLWAFSVVGPLMLAFLSLAKDLFFLILAWLWKLFLWGCVKAAIFYFNYAAFITCVAFGISMFINLRIMGVLDFDPFSRPLLKRYLFLVFVYVLCYCLGFLTLILSRLYFLGPDEFFNEWSDVCDFGFLVTEYFSFLVAAVGGLYFGWWKIVGANLVYFSVDLVFLFSMMVYLNYYYPVKVFLEPGLPDCKRRLLLRRRSGFVYSLLSIIFWPVLLVSGAIYGSFVYVCVCLSGALFRLVESLLCVYYYVVLFTPISFYLFVSQFRRLWFRFLYRLRFIFVKLRIEWFWAGRTFFTVGGYVVNFLKRRLFSGRAFVLKIFVLRIFYIFGYLPVAFFVGFLVWLLLCLRIAIAYFFSLMFLPIKWSRAGFNRLRKLEDFYAVGRLMPQRKRVVKLTMFMLAAFLIISFIGHVIF